MLPIKLMQKPKKAPESPYPFQCVANYFAVFRKTLSELWAKWSWSVSAVPNP